MANKTIPLREKELVVKRLAEGQSTRQAIEGTSIASNQTAARIAKTETHKITQYRTEYIEAINKWTGHSEHRARLLNQMLYATKPEVVMTYTGKSRNNNSTTKQYTYSYVEDWDTRLKAIKYIDQLTGVMPMQGGLNINLLQQVNKSK